MAMQSRTWVVDFDSDAVLDFEDVKTRGDRKAVFNVVQKLRDLGPDLRLGQMFLVLAVAAKKKDFDRAVKAAIDRLNSRR
jgi:hypothetical protein